MTKIKHVFGPVASRRLGISLGVDIIPYKTCTLDCIYCECGKTTNLTLERQRFVNPHEVLDEISSEITGDTQIQYITFSGSGEPTLNIDLGTIINGIKQITHIPVAVLTNGTLLHLPEVRKDLMAADLVLPSLDAATPDAFARINLHHKDLNMNTYIAGLKEFCHDYQGQIWLEVFLAKGVNDSPAELDALYHVLKDIQADRIQLNSLDRPPAYENVFPLNVNELQTILEKWYDLPVEIIKRTRHRGEIDSFSLNLENNILNTIQRRPLTIEDLETLTGKRRTELFKYIDVLEREKKVIAKIVGDHIFFAPAE